MASYVLRAMTRATIEVAFFCFMKQYCLIMCAAIEVSMFCLMRQYSLTYGAPQLRNYRALICVTMMSVSPLW